MSGVTNLNPKIKSGRFDDLIEEKGPLARHLECGSNTTRNDAKAPKMRLKVRRLWQGVKQKLPIQFGHDQLTSYGGLELVRRYFQLIELKARIRRALGKHAGGDYGGSHLVLLVIGYWWSARGGSS